MNKMTLFLIILVYAVTSNAQEIKKSFKNGASDQLTIKADYPGLTILPSSSTNIKVEGYVTVNDVSYPGAMKITWDEDSRVISISSDFSYMEDQANQEEDSKLKKKEENNEDQYWSGEKNRKYGDWNYDGHVKIFLPSAVKDLRIKSTYGHIELKHMTAIMNIEATYGPIDAVMNQKVKICHLTSPYNTVTLKVPEGLKSDVRLETHYGEILTNVELDINRSRSVHKQFKDVIFGTLNGGGTSDISLRSDYNEVILKQVEK